MIYTRMINFLCNFLFFAANCRIFIGCRPAAVHAPAVIFFPLMPGKLNCGFAGLMTCRLPEKAATITADITAATLWEKIKSAGLPAISAGKDKVANYLGGTATIASLNMAVRELKREDAQEFLFFETKRAAALAAVTAAMKQFLAQEEEWLEKQATVINSGDLETINSRLLLGKDICWMLEQDILANLQKVLMLTGAVVPSLVKPAAFRKYRKLNLLLNALDRLEVRGRDSAGIQLTFIINDEKKMAEINRLIRQNEWDEDYQRRTQQGDLLNHSIAIAENSKNGAGNTSVAFTYKTFSIVGELGRNVAKLRNDIQNDRILQYFATAEAVCETALAHTRWASVGSISEDNCHPVNNFTINNNSSACPFYPGVAAQINVVLNGDIDNYPELRQDREAGSELIAPQITTDTKIIPLQIEKYLKAGENLTESFRLAVNDFTGSHAIAMTSNLAPGKIFLALRGSGQSIYVGISDDQYLFSSELYGLVEVMPRFLQMNGEAGHGAAAGQIFILDQNSGGGSRGISALFYDGAVMQLTDDDLRTAEITTRDIDRSGYPHYFLKEISESALSVKRTLRGKYHISAEGLSPARVIFNLGADMVPAALHKDIVSGAIKNIIIIGQGTAAVAGQAVADAFAHYLKGTKINIRAGIASELSGFGLKDDLRDTLIIPISQSGTTTDTNRAVAMAGERGARIISIVNRRQSDITGKSHGVFYTSDGRDIEMSVASTKAFYSQIVAGQILALFFAQLLGARSDEEIAAALLHLEGLPQLMDQLLAKSGAIADSAKNAAGKRYWAVVGSGPNKAAADEIRIKLSELCYKTISSDIVENKKHIDLSAEPLILVCAAGNPEAVLEDVAKDAAIFKAHKATVLVFAEEGDDRFDRIADAVIGIPAAPSPLPVILNTMAGHLWGYYAACAIDSEAQTFREFRSCLAAELAQRARKKLSVFDMIADVSLRRFINEFYFLFNSRLQNGAFGTLGGKTLADLLLLLKYAAGKLPPQDIRRDFPGKNDFFSPHDLLDATLAVAIDELTRPIDAIRHQAKTVTVGTSRKEKELAGIIFDLLETLDFTIKNLTYRNILTISRSQPAVAGVRGYALYDIHKLDEQGSPAADSLIAVRAKGGVAAGMKSRADQPTPLMGVKRTIISTGHVYLGRGKVDGAPIMIIPLRGDKTEIGNLLLIHIRFNEKLSLAEKKAALGYRYNDIRNLVDEYNILWNDRYLEAFSLEGLFSEPADLIAAQIKSQFAT